MCGIVGILSSKPVVSRVVDGLKRLEYRGYDSAGVAVIHDGKIDRCRAKGKLAALDEKTKKTGIEGVIGIGHTRWATHGAPTETNAHPHATDKVAVVHNGIIENYQELRAELEKEGAVFQSQTDTEVVPHLITKFLKAGDVPLKAVQNALAKLHGAFALGIIFADYPKMLIGARRGSPLAVGYANKEFFLGSDAIALSSYTDKIAYLEEGDVVVLQEAGIEIYDEHGKPALREVRSITLAAAAHKDKYPHYMLKEIHEQSAVLAEVLQRYYDPSAGKVKLPEFPFDMKKVNKVTLIACGTSYYSGFIAKYWLERLAKVQVEIDFASEFRYRDAVMTEGEVAVFISQSGETADTLAALRYAKEQGQHCIAIVNVPESSMAREASLTLPIYAGPEIGVASTKAFTAQLMVLASFALALAEARGTVGVEEMKKQSYALSQVPALVAEILRKDPDIKQLAIQISHARDAIYIGRGPAYGLAMEGALKLKEISYIHAEALAAGELKHGTIALIDPAVPVVALAPSDHWFEKTASNIEEVAARGGRLLVLAERDGYMRLKHVAEHVVEMPKTTLLSAPMIYAIPVQLLAYHAAVARGTDVDQPRNLAKSVTVE